MIMVVEWSQDLCMTNAGFIQSYISIMGIGIKHAFMHLLINLDRCITS